MSGAPHPETEARLRALEERWAFAERTLEDLSAVLYQQEKTIEELRRELERLRHQVGDELPEAPNEPPPHY